MKLLKRMVISDVLFFETSIQKNRGMSLIYNYKPYTRRSISLIYSIYKIGIKLLPVKLLLSRYSSSSIVKFQIALGMDPLKWFEAKENCWSSEHWDNVEGIWPVKLLPPRPSQVSFWRPWQMLSGRMPDNLLLIKEMACNEEILEMWRGNGPESWLCSIIKFSKLLRFWNSIGTLPSRELCDSHSVYKFDMLEMEGGIEPVKLLFLRERYGSLCK